jgi:nucleotide-binding universal stress UspA family protein
MKLLKTILVAVDFDDTLDTILAVASTLAKKLGSEVVLAHVEAPAQEAIERFDQCLSIDSRCADAIEAKAESCDRLGRREQTDECRELAEAIRRELGEQRVTASVRAQHPFFQRRGPCEEDIEGGPYLGKPKQRWRAVAMSTTHEPPQATIHQQG